MSDKKPTPPEPTDAPLFEAFSFPTYEEWYEATVASLKGRPFEKLISQTYESITLQPMYRQADIADLPHLGSLPGEYPYVRGTKPDGYLQQPWLIAQEMAHGTPQQFNEALRHDLERGQTAVNLIPDRPSRRGQDPDQADAAEVGHKGVSIAAAADFTAALAGVDLASIPLFVRSGSGAFPLAALLFASVRESGGDTAVLHGSLEADPLGELARRGELPLPLTNAYDEIAALLRWTRENAPDLDILTVHGYPYGNAGGSAVQELGAALATAVAYLRALQERDIDVDAAAAGIRFAFNLGGDLFMEIGKLRAARMLWAQIVEAFGGGEAAQKMRLHGRSARWNKTLTDIHVNMLRGTTEAFAGAVGGVDSLHIAPFDEEVKEPDAFSRRIARNVHVILQEEANLIRLVDPAGGAYFVEWLTDQIAQKAWAFFQEIEAQGGMAAALQSGFVPAQVAGVAAQRAKNLAKRKDVLVGTNMYANLDEELPAVEAADDVVSRERAEAIAARRVTHHDLRITDVETAVTAAQNGATLGQVTAVFRQNTPDDDQLTIQPVHWHRGAEPFEALRANAAAYAEREGHPPRIFLANMGPLRRHKARADFTRGFFEVGGFESIYPDGFDTPEAAAQAALASGANAVVICAADADYPEIVPDLVQGIKDVRGETAVILAGYPKDQIEAHKAAGVDEFIYLGADCLALNQWLQEKLLGK